MQVLTNTKTALRKTYMSNMHVDHISPLSETIKVYKIWIPIEVIDI